jgi:hypothetical protein|tara:strand:+ start:483 stop:671 length:189 start_codon:yes stop_codon:yes gene_type:complete
MSITKDERLFQSKGTMTTEEIIQQLWECLRRGYNYREAQLHMKAYGEGKKTIKKVVVIEEDK